MKTWVSHIAIKTAFSSTYRKYRHAAVIEHGGTIISKGVNSLRPFNPWPDGKYSTHAEEAALNKARRKSAGASLYVARVGRSGTLRNSKPCPKCLAYIKDSGIRHVYYSISHNEWGFIQMW